MDTEVLETAVETTPEADLYHRPGTHYPHFHHDRHFLMGHPGDRRLDFRLSFLQPGHQHRTGRSGNRLLADRAGLHHPVH